MACVVLSIGAVVAAFPVMAAPAARKRARARLRTTLYLHARGDVRLQTRTIQRALEEELATRKKVLSFVRLRRVLEPGVEARRQLKIASKKAKDARELLANLEVDQGIALLKEALAIRERYFDTLVRDPSEVGKQAYLLADLAMASFLAGDEKATRDAILQAFILNPKLEYNGERYPPQMKRTFDESRFLADELGTGNAEVSTTPEGAEVWANGNFVGFSPLTVRGLAAGRNLVTLLRPGYKTVTLPANVTGGDLAAELKVQLKPIPGAPMDELDQALDAAGAAGPSARVLASVARKLKRQVLFVGVAQGVDDMITVRIYAYHAGRGKVLGKVEATVSAMDPGSECRELVSSLVTLVTARPKPAASRRGEMSGRGPWWSRVSKARWFWPVVGVAVGAVVAGTTVGVYYGTRAQEKNDRRRTLVLLPAGMGARF